LRQKSPTPEVVEAEMGMHASPRWIHSIAERFRERFGAEEIDAVTFVDRIRGFKEDWSNY